MVQGSLYLLRRKCGKPTCRCTRGELHPAWVLTRSEGGKNHLYAVPADQRGPLRPLTREYRRWQRTRALRVKQFARLLALVDELAEHRLQRWPPPNPMSLEVLELEPVPRRKALAQIRRLGQSFLTPLQNLPPP